MCPSLVALSLALFLDPPYDARADRARFPPDVVLLDWYAFNEARQLHLQAQIDDPLLTMRPGVRKQLEAELREVQRIRRVIFWVAYPKSEGEPEAKVRYWMREARKCMTPQEYAAGYVPWGGVP